MATNRLIHWEQDVERTLASEVGDLPVAVRNLSKWVGQEIDDLRKEESGPAPATGATIITSVTGSPAATIGIIAIIEQPVIAGPNLIRFASSLSSSVYGGFLILADSDGVLIDSAELRMRATSMTVHGFNYNAPQDGTLYGFAMVAT